MSTSMISVGSCQDKEAYRNEVKAKRIYVFGFLMDKGKG